MKSLILSLSVGLIVAAIVSFHPSSIFFISNSSESDTNKSEDILFSSFAPIISGTVSALFVSIITRLKD